MSEDKKDPLGPDEEADVIDVEAAWGPYLTDTVRDAADVEAWDLGQVRVWPAGKEGPAVALTELAAWRAEVRRVRAALQARRE